MNGIADGYERLIGVGFAFCQAQVLCAAVELDLFSLLAERPMTGDELATRAELHPRGARVLLEALVKLGLLQRSGDAYANTPTAACYLVASSRWCIGDLFSFAGDRLYPVWSHLAEALRTGSPQNEAKVEPGYYDNLWASTGRHMRFLRGMDALSVKAAATIAARFPWTRYGSFVDVGGARGAVAVQVAAAHPHLTGGTFELAAVQPYFDDLVRHRGLSQRLRFYAGDFFVDPLPRADVIIMGHVLHNWGPDQKQSLMQKAFDALPPWGALIVYEWFLEEADDSVLGHLMSLNMLLVTSQGCGMSRDDCARRLREAGFVRADLLAREGPCSIVVASKTGDGVSVGPSAVIEREEDNERQ